MTIAQKKTKNRGTGAGFFGTLSIPEMQIVQVPVLDCIHQL